MIKKEAQNIAKYKDLRTESQRMWNVRAKVVPEIRGDRDHPRITQQIPEQRTGKARN